ncbi:MAG: S46 family peptidase [Burkholderiales bacterium]
MRFAYGLLFALIGLIAPAAGADEGVWTFDRLPAKALQDKYAFAVPSAALSDLRGAAVRVLGVGSGAFVSGDGLVLTNHHVAMSCISRLSSAGDDLVGSGFEARTRAAERRCPGGEVRHLQSTQDVTEAVRAAVRSRDPAAANAERKAAIATIEKECNARTGLLCEVVTLYRGASYHLYRYRVWSDVRLVFAPAERDASFGGDFDNFVYPRFDLDIAFLRVYDGGEPVKTPFLRFATVGVEEGDLVFTAGHPGSTDRSITLSQLEFLRDVRFPLRIAKAERQLEVVRGFAAASPESARRASDLQGGYENWLKSMRGEYKALKEPALIEAKRRQEAELRKAFARLAGAPDPWTGVDRAMRAWRPMVKRDLYVDYAFGSLFEQAGTLVELAGESKLPESERLSGYRPSAIPGKVRRVTADSPYYKDLEIARLAGDWQQALEELGKDDPYIRRVLGDKTPLEAATFVVVGTRLDEAQERKRLLDGGAAAIAASTDPLIVLSRDVYPMRRSVARRYEVDVESPSLLAGETLERVRYGLYGADAYPDATFTLRLGYGTVRGYDADGILTPWRTNFWGRYARSAAFGGKPPFDMGAQWIERRGRLEMSTPLDFVATLDLAGGSSGSPVVNRKGEIVGVVFDRNLEGLGGRFAYTDRKARAVIVDSRGIIEALAKLYDARELLTELGVR